MANRAGWDVPLPVSGAEEPDAAGCEDGEDEEGWSTAGRVQPASSRPASAAAAARRQRECFRTMGAGLLPFELSRQRGLLYWVAEQEPGRGKSSNYP